MATDEVMLQATFGIWPGDPTDKDRLANGRPTIVANLAATYEWARKLATDFRERLDQLRAAGQLTEAGITAELTRFAAAKLNELDSYAAARLNEARAERDRLRERLTSLPVDKADATADHYVRLALLELPDAERWAEIHRAVEDGETAVVRAVLGAPRFLQRRLMSVPGMLDDLRQAWANGRDPETARELRELDAAIDAVKRVLSQVRQFILATPGLEAGARKSLMVALGTDPILDNGRLRAEA